MRSYLLVLRFAAFNVVALALLVVVWLEGWIGRVVEADITHITSGIAVVFAAGWLMLGGLATLAAALVQALAKRLDTVFERLFGLKVATPWLVVAVVPPTSSTTGSLGLTSPWARMHRTPEMSSLPPWEKSSRCPRSVGSTTDTNAAPRRRPVSPQLTSLARGAVEGGCHRIALRD